MQVSPVNGLPGNQTHQDDDDDFDRALSLSLKVPSLELLFPFCWELGAGGASLSLRFLIYFKMN